MPMQYLPSPVEPRYKQVYAATANKSGRMQYHKITPGYNKLRITRTEFIKVYNTLAIIAMKPLRNPSSTDLQLEFYV